MALPLGLGGLAWPGFPFPRAYLTALHVLHIHGVLHALPLLFLVLLLLAAALLADAEAAGEEQQASNHGNGDQSPGWHYPQKGAPELARHAAGLSPRAGQHRPGRDSPRCPHSLQLYPRLPAGWVHLLQVPFTSALRSPSPLLLGLRRESRQSFRWNPRSLV